MATPSKFSCQEEIEYAQGLLATMSTQQVKKALNRPDIAVIEEALGEYIQRRSDTPIIAITVQGGSVEEVSSTLPHLTYVMIDLDNADITTEEATLIADTDLFVKGKIADITPFPDEQ